MQGGLSNGGGGTELSEGVDVGGNAKDDGDPTPLEYLQDPEYGEFNMPR
jgi:hypothetical protein